MKRFNVVKDCQHELQSVRQSKKSLGFIPTMGCLHEGHLSLIKKAQSLCDKIIVSIFVNPTQFGPTEDFNTYPRPIDQDIQLLNELNVDYVFTPTANDIYPSNKIATHVYVPSLSTIYCGKTRPHFFQGVTSVVSRLFNIIMPDVAIFGEKDFQQLVIIKQMVKDLFFPITILSGPIIRESNGLAMSSRNQYLSAQEHNYAASIYAALSSAKTLFERGVFDSHLLIDHIRQMLKNNYISIDYVNIVNQDTLDPVQHCEKTNRILIAGYLNQTRLIDNLAL